MMCPSCHATLEIAERQGIEIDYCPRCRGVWLDRGELDKIIERSASGRFEDERPRDQARYPDDRRFDRRRDDDDDDDRRRGRRRGGFLGELFDFD